MCLALATVLLCGALYYDQYGSFHAVEVAEATENSKKVSGVVVKSSLDYYLLMVRILLARVLLPFSTDEPLKAMQAE